MLDLVIIIAQVLFILACLLISFAILLQEGKGGGLSALAGGSSQQVIGTSNPLRRFTVVLAIAFIGLALILALAMGARATPPGDNKKGKDQMQGEKTSKEKKTGKTGAGAKPGTPPAEKP